MLQYNGTKIIITLSTFVELSDKIGDKNNPPKKDK